MKLPVINKTYLILKAHFFLFQGGFAPVLTAAPVYAQTLGFSSFIVGVIFTVIPLLSLLIKPICGGIADRFRCHKKVMIIAEIICLVSYFSVQFIPSGYAPASKIESKTLHNVSFSLCSGGMGIEPYIKAEKRDPLLTSPCTISCVLTPEMLLRWCNFLPKGDDTCYFYPTNNSTIDPTLIQNQCRKLDILNLSIPSKALKLQQNSSTTNCSSNCEEGKNFWETNGEGESMFQDDSITLHQYQFYLFALLLLGGNGGVIVSQILADTICIVKCDNPHDYGKQRLWGSIGFGIFSIMSGFIVDVVSGPGPKDYTPAFYLTLIIMGIDLILSHFLIKVEIPEKSENIAKDVWKSLLNIKIIVFLLWCTAMGVSMGISGNFLYWLLEDLAREQGASTVANIKTIEGLAMGVQTFIGETPAFFFAGWVLTKIGHSHCMSLILFVIGLRFTLFSFLINPWLVLVIEPLHLYYALFYSTMTSYAAMVAPPGTQATVQSIMIAMCGIGAAVGSFVGGYLYDTYKGHTTFRIMGIAFITMAISNEAFEFVYRLLTHKTNSVVPVPRKAISSS